MNYMAVYTALMDKGRTRGLHKPALPYSTERHHVIPRCQGGRNTKENYVLLTPKEHYVAHHLLHKAYPNNPPLFRAYRAMALLVGSWSSSRAKIGISANEYQRLKEKAASLRRGTHHTVEALAKMRQPRKHTGNMRKPKSRTARLIAEHQRRFNDPAYKERFSTKGTHFTWYTDGRRDFRIKEGAPIPKGLVPGRSTARGTQQIKGDKR